MSQQEKPPETGAAVDLLRQGYLPDEAQLPDDGATASLPSRVGPASAARVYDYWLGGKDHFLTDADDPAATVAGLRQVMALFTPRTAEQLTELLAGFELLDPGVVPVGRWRPGGRTVPARSDATAGQGLAVLARVPDAATRWAGQVGSW